MDEHASQLVVPESFVDLYRSPGRGRLSAPKDEIAERYGLCEDLAQLLTGHARAMLFELGITEEDVLTRCHRGLLDHASGVSADEARWVLRRLAELLEWPDPRWLADSGGAGPSQAA